MKTLTKSTLAILIALFLSTNMFAEGFEMEQEQYIDDIPFNTEKIANQAILENAIYQDFSINEESVNDIPFNTFEIASHKLYELAQEKEFDTEEEGVCRRYPFQYTIDSIAKC